MGMFGHTGWSATVPDRAVHVRDRRAHVPGHLRGREASAKDVVLIFDLLLLAGELVVLDDLGAQATRLVLVLLDLRSDPGARRGAAA